MAHGDRSGRAHPDDRSGRANHANRADREHDKSRSRTVRSFEDLVRERTGPDFVERSWLYDRVARALDTEAARYVLVTGEPGAGKTSLLAGLARTHPDRPRYFVRRDSRTALAGGDVQSFLLSIGDQLARTRPELFAPQRLEVVVRQHIDSVEAGGSAVGIRIADLTVSPFHRTATLELEQRITRAAGSVTGVEIGTAGLEPRLLEPDNLAYLALIGPAEVLLADDPGARIVILLDALDELAAGGAGPSGLLHWLARGPELPPNVAIVMTSRPHSALAALRSARAGLLTEVPVEPGSPEVADDLLTYADRALGTEQVDSAVRARGLLPDQFRRSVVRRAAGNFLYLSAYARALAEAVGRNDTASASRLLDPDGFPQGLAGLYAFFVETARAELERLGMLEIRDPVGPADTLTPAWEGVGQPLLGLLTVAREPLAFEELTAFTGIRVWPRAVRTVLSRLRWLLDVREDGVALYHSSIGEFLTGERARTEHPDCWVDALEWHERIVRHIRGGAADWADVDWDAVAPYGLRHIAEHVLSCRGALADGAVDLVGPGLLRAVRRAFGTNRHFQRIVDRIADHAIGRLPTAASLPAVMYLGTVRRQVLRASRGVPPPVLGLLARMGRVPEALERMEAMEPSLQQFAGVREIVRHAPPDAPGPSPRELLELLVDTALTVPASDESAVRPGTRPPGPLREAAEALAPHDLRRALRLWDLAWQAETEGREGELPAEFGVPDPVYRAAAGAETDTGRAAALVASMRLPADRAHAFLDLAGRARAAEVPELLRRAEESLGGVKPPDRLRGLARLAAAWAGPDRARSAALLAEVRTDSVRHRDERGIAEALADAAAAVCATDGATARHLLERLESVPLNGVSERPYLRAARLWVDLGHPGRARALLDRVLDWSGRVSNLVEAGAVLARCDAEAARRMVERAWAAVPAAGPAHTSMSRSLQASSLAAAARGLAVHDPVRAAEIARGIGRTEWSSFGDDRSSALAGIAHRCLDTGRNDTAEALLEECLRFGDLVPPPAAEQPPGNHRPVRGPDGGEPAGWDRPEDFLPGLTAMFNASHEWAARGNRYFYRDPVEVVRAVSPGPHSWARTVRTVAEAVAARDPARALGLVRSLACPEERAIGLATLFLRASEQDRPEAAALSEELDEALGALPRYTWIRGDADGDAWAYLRP
ncbi:hypothetical protein, partial [Streptomyces sp. URMC 123]|uniref:hypothetical protein n=1 Tax=Streptomyces sp. URMC 123 TaxID=3423403 RepID=UPI003F53E459